MSITKTEIVNQFGSYYKNGGQSIADLKSAIRQPSVTTSFAKPIVTDGEVYQFANVKFQEIVQQFQKKFTAKGNVDFIPNEIRLRNIKIDLSLYPDDVKGSWLGFLQTLSVQERAQWPIVRFLLENEVVPQLHQDMEMKAYFSGVYEAPVEGVAGSASKTLDGIKKLIDDGLAEANVNKKMQAVALSGPLTAATMFDRVEEFADSIDEVLTSIPFTIYMSKKNLKAYLRDKRNTHGQDINYKAEKLTVDFADNIKLESLPSMAGSDYIWGTPDINYLYLRRENGMKDPKVEEHLREVFLMLDWWEGLGFGYNPLVYAYKPEA